MNLAGHIVLQPGRQLGNQAAIVSTRPDLAPRLLRGAPLAQAPGRLAALFTLCSHAHRFAANAALAAATGRDATPDAADLAALQAATAREQAVRVLHDWPLASGGVAAGGAQIAAWLAQPTPLSPPAAWRERAQALPVPAMAPLTPDDLPALAARMLEPGFCQAPQRADGVPDTGPWTRLHDPQRGSAATAWDRLLARCTDLQRLLRQPRWLAHGVLPLGPGEALAYVEMARGLLLHRVCVDGGHIADYRVLAPTEWNFHPHGVLAQALQHADAADAQLLAAAFDPCVPVRLQAREPAHA